MASEINNPFVSSLPERTASKELFNKRKGIIPLCALSAPLPIKLA